MNGRLRSLAALLALASFTVTLAVSGFCVPMPAADAVAVGAEPAHDAHGAHTTAPDGEPGHPAGCPAGMGGGASCSAAPLPALTAAVSLAASVPDVAHAAPQLGVELLVTHPFFHPPRI